ncbi:hypothetical protein [Phenylobacterium sp.]|jgi:hypothetical protein|uniref:hypothetical protein n=1 Tax=Phenylobacterium sp. TaxID=1871053 RepID=UPI0037C62BD6
MAALSERLAAVEQRLHDHETRCEERLGEIRAAAGSTLRAVEALKARAWGVTAALLAWALAQIWSGHADPPHPHPPEPPPSSARLEPQMDPQPQPRRPA